MIRILHVLSSLDGGGVESMITNYYYNFKNNDIVFDFAVHNPNIGILEKELKDRKSNIYHLTPKKTSLIKNIKELCSIINKEKYDAIYCHQNFISWIPLFIAKIKGVKVRIVHSHGCNPPKTLIKKIRNTIERLLLKTFATNFFACGIEASKWLYGKDWTEEYPKKVIINNAIDINRFSFNKDIRDKLRKKNNINDKICIFHAGRFSAEKNHKYIIDIYSKLPADKYCLFLAGNGELYNSIIDYSKRLNLKNIHFLGVRSDVNELYLMADLFLLPSFHEGFPVTLVEAQCSGLKCIASTNVSDETKMLKKTSFIPLDCINKWIEEIINIDIDDRRTETDALRNKGFDITIESLKYYELLRTICKK